MQSDSWCVTVVRCKSEETKNMLIDFFSFLESLEGVEDLHFLIRDCIDDEVVFSFRVLIKPKMKKVVRSKIAYKLKRLTSEDKFGIDPGAEDPLQKYVAWSSKGEIAKHGPKKFVTFCRLLSQLSRIVVDMAKQGYFDSSERVEIAHVTSWMLGCTEYGILTAAHMEVGYYDRIKDKYYPHLKQGFGE